MSSLADSDRWTNPSPFMRFAVPCVFFIVLLGIWEESVRIFHISPLILPAPSAVIYDFWMNAGSLLRSLCNTFLVTIEAFILATLCGVTLAIVFSRFVLLELAIGPLMVITQVTPMVAIAPLILVWVGLDHVNEAILWIAVVIAFFPIMSNTLLGLRSINFGLRDMFVLYRANSWQRLVYLELPSVLPYILSGMRIAGGLALIGAVVAEFVAGSGTNPGLAWRIVEASNRMNAPRMFSALALLCCLGVLISSLLACLQYVCLRRWHESAVRKDS